MESRVVLSLGTSLNPRSDTGDISIVEDRGFFSALASPVQPELLKFKLAHATP